MTDENKTTNERIAELLLDQTYAERMEMARFFIGAISDWPGNDIDPDQDSMASLLESWADNELSLSEEQ